MATLDAGSSVPAALQELLEKEAIRKVIVRAPKLVNIVPA